MERGNIGRRLLVWDAPNMDMCLSEVIGERATSATRPNLGAVLAWLRGRAEPADVIEGCVFCNVPPGVEATMSAWVGNLRHAGLAVFAKPKRDRRDDVDADMLRHVDRRFGHGTLRHLVVASHDAKAFSAPLQRLATAGVLVEVLGYREKDTYASGSGTLTFVDVEDVPGAFERPLPRTNLFDLPSSGRWFEPFAAATETAPDGVPGSGSGTPSAVGASSAHDRRMRRRPVDREVVLREVERAVGDAAAAGGDGLSLREVGHLLRQRHPEHDLDDLGFESVVELVEALVAPGTLELVRQADDRHVLVPRAELVPSGPETSAAAPLAGPVPTAPVHPIYRVFGSAPTGPDDDTPRPHEVPPNVAAVPGADLDDSKATRRGRVVLVHGFAQTGGCWGPVPDALEAAGYSVATPDLPGHGDGPPDALDLPATGRHVLAVAAAMAPTGRAPTDIAPAGAAAPDTAPAGTAEAGTASSSGPPPAQPAIFVGYSFGGRICLRLAVDHPEAVERLVLIGATAGLDDPGERQARREADDALAARIESDGVDAFLDRWLALPLFAGLSPEAQHRDERLRNRPSGLAGSLRRAGTGAQDPIWDRLGALAGVPVLLVTGERDAKFAALADRLAAGIGPSASRLVVPDAGHTAHLERPDAFLDGLLGWLALA